MIIGSSRLSSNKAAVQSLRWTIPLLLLSLQLACVPAYRDTLAIETRSVENGGPDRPRKPAEGAVSDRSGRIKAYIESDGAITDRTGYSEGYIESNGTITDRYGRVKGYVNEDGTITDRAGRVQGYIDEDGTVTDRAGRVEGYVE